MREGLLPSAVFIKPKVIDDDMGDIHQFRFLLNEDFPDNEFLNLTVMANYFLLGFWILRKGKVTSFSLKSMMGKGGIWTGEISVMVSNDETEDVDEDGLIEKLENANGLSDFNPDFDNDGFDDLTELNAGTNPKDPSSVPLRANQPPTKLFLSSVEISENSPLSTRGGHTFGGRF